MRRDPNRGSTISDMDPAALVLPGAQSLVTAVLTDAWETVRSGLARTWARRHTDRHTGTSVVAADAPDAAAIEHAGRELDSARTQALELAGHGDEASRAARMELFWAGYLAGQLAARPELAEALQALPALLGSRTASEAGLGTVHNSSTGTVRGNLVQARDIAGDINFR